jgi:integrase
VPALNGVVFRYASGRDGWYYRELIPGTKRYRMRRIEGANTLSEALRDAYRAFMDLSGTEISPDKFKPSERRTGSTIQEEVEKYLINYEQRVNSNLLAENGLRRLGFILRVNMLGYLKTQGVTKPSQITETTFDEYFAYRRHCAKQTLKTESKAIGTFIRTWLVRHKRVSVEVGMSPNLMPKVRMNFEDLDANPAISAHDYDLINKRIRYHYIRSAQKRSSLYFRQMFWCLIHTLKNTGARPIELLAVRYKDITITNPKRYSVGMEDDVDDFKGTIFLHHTKTGRPRDIICRSNAAERIVKFRQFQKQYFEANAIKPPTEDSLFFGKPAELMLKTYSHNYLNQIWKQEIVDPIKDQLEGNRYSDKNYTIYSLRTTFIENCILDGIDIYTVATLCGNSVKTIQRHYDRHDVLTKAADIQQIERGRKKQEKPEEFSIL